MIAAYRGHKDIVKLLLEHEPALQDLDKFGKTAADKAQNTTIAALIQSSLLKAQFVEQRNSRDARPRFLTPYKPKRQLSKPSGQPAPTQRSPRTSAKRSVGKLIQSIGHSKATELLDGFMDKMKRKMSAALESEVVRELEEQLEKADAGLQNGLCDDFCQQSKAAVRNGVQVFNSKMAEALHKRGLEVTADLKLDCEDIMKQIQEAEIDCNYVHHNPVLLSTLKTSSQILSPQQKRPLSPSSTRPGQTTSEQQFGLDLIGYLGTQFEQMSTELRHAITTTIATTMQQAFGQFKTVYLSSNKTSFDFLKCDLGRKLDSTLKEKLTRAELRLSLATAKHKRGVLSANASMSPSLTERAHPGHRSLWTGTLGMKFRSRLGTFLQHAHPVQGLRVPSPESAATNESEQ
jgi:hypothetical protein